MIKDRNIYLASAAFGLIILILYLFNFYKSIEVENDFDALRTHQLREVRAIHGMRFGIIRIVTSTTEFLLLHVQGKKKSPDKDKVFHEVYRVLAPTGRLLVSDIVTEGELPEAIKESFAAWASCVAGALEKRQYLDTIQRAGFKHVNIVNESTYDIDVSEELKGKITSIQVEATKN